MLRLGENSRSSHLVAARWLQNPPPHADETPSISEICSVSSQSNPRVEALVEAYQLIESVQTPDAPLDAVERLDALALDRGWLDLRALTQWAQVLHARHSGVDASAPLQAMLECAECTRDPALVALALSTSVFSEAIGGPIVVSTGLGDALTRSVVLLDDGSEFAAHRCAAHIEVALCFHTRGLWELASQHYDLAERAWPAGTAPLWLPVVRCQQRVIGVNRLEILLDWCCALAEVDDWEAAAWRAAQALPQADLLAGWDIPASWIGEVWSYRSLLAALAGVPRNVEAGQAARSAHDAGDALGRAIVAVADAVRHYRAGELDRAARRAAPVVEEIGFPAPVQLKLLAFRLAAAGRNTPVVARRYAEELARLRWEARLARHRALGSAIDAERQRVEHRELRHQVLTDDLTGLATRRAYRAYVAGLAERPAPSGAATGLVAVMMIDVDHFKQINDRFGHDIGDAVLRQLGAILAGHVRAVDLAARLGGDEFVVVLDQVSPEVAEVRADEILRSVLDHDWSSLAQGLVVLISLGWCMSGANAMETALARADRSLYEAKRSGRNKAVLASDGNDAIDLR
jgi:diguanylate cyclase (GGDEF)-like protein